ncbi:hypothetical protein RRX38_20460 [Pseudomonas sp. DTU_2021_1001937_2_SI_NGA_ILE_001]|uniref:hypothetical protein n=1 Tax=Pseudomonas sp. DTU_2021_1001937_2_SI_NGA_ILE_001 TaxID=3077589 RepID=UPI0028FC317C|nr:hypothetical protein [Pseudomonas sp. DTU_2021_1001937_2_SI_NGA_ILE_001]WNW13427.1 hypothetical protein RRX38_20460 [Pseudomonas sp. DTU_2021_1001937_2_SI_NGA_ILE_001]
MKWMNLSWLVLASIGLAGCQNVRMPWEPEPTVHQRGYHAGCAAKRGAEYDEHAGRDLPQDQQQEFAAGFSEGYALCDPNMDLRPWISNQPMPTLPSEESRYPKTPWELERKQKEECNDEHRLCFPPPPNTP